MREAALGTLVAVLGALGVALVGQLIGLFGGPDPSGSVSVTQTQRDQTLRMFRGQALEPADDEQLGLTLDVRRHGKNVSARGCRLRWTYLNVDGPTPVADSALVAQRARNVSPDPRSCTSQTRMWIPVTTGLEGYERIAVRVEMFAGSHLLGSALSEISRSGVQARLSAAASRKAALAGRHHRVAVTTRKEQRPILPLRLFGWLFVLLNCWSSCSR